MYAIYVGGGVLDAPLTLVNIKPRGVEDGAVDKCKFAGGRSPYARKAGITGFVGAATCRPHHKPPLSTAPGRRPLRIFCIIIRKND